MDYNRDIRAALDKHMTMGTWRIVDEGDRMEITGQLKANGAVVTIRGFRSDVLSTMEGLVRVLVETERIPKDPPKY